MRRRHRQVGRQTDRQTDRQRKGYLDNTQAQANKKRG